MMRAGSGSVRQMARSRNGMAANPDCERSFNKTLTGTEMTNQATTNTALRLMDLHRYAMEKIPPMYAEVTTSEKYLTAL